MGKTLTSLAGWYDIYDTDEVMNIVAAQQRIIAKWIKKYGKHGTDC